MDWLCLNSIIIIVYITYFCLMSVVLHVFITTFLLYLLNIQSCILLDECSIVSLLHFFVLNTHDHSNSRKTCCFNVLCMYNVKWNITLSIIHKCIAYESHIGWNNDSQFFFLGPALETQYMYPPHCHPSLGSSSDRQTSRPGSGCRLSWRCRCFWLRGRRTGTIAPAVSSCPVGSSCLQFYIKTTNITS